MDMIGDARQGDKETRRQADDGRPITGGNEPSSFVLRPSSVELRIAELALHGFAPADRHRIGNALERELRRLIEERGIPQRLISGAHADALDGGAFEVAPHAKAETIGAQIAQAVYGGLNR